METKVALATYAELPDLIEGDQLAVEALERHDIAVQAAVWDDRNIDWTQYSAVVIRSCWDYHQRAEEFLGWLEWLEGLAVPLWNPVEVVRWNMNKTYLRDLQESGVEVLPSVWLPQYAEFNLVEFMKERDWPRVVVKPVISAAADHTHLIAVDQVSEKQAEIDFLLQRGGLIVQQFAEEIESQGEWSFMFYGGQYSHAVLKRPTAGDFRVQPHLGGTHAVASPEVALIDQARAALSAVDGCCTPAWMPLSAADDYCSWSWNWSSPIYFSQNIPWHPSVLRRRYLNIY
jgi:glutathione synthase/RimK-type ligase-like ATP-grasp enzyme